MMFALISLAFSSVLQCAQINKVVEHELQRARDTMRIKIPLDLDLILSALVSYGTLPGYSKDVLAINHMKSIKNALQNYKKKQYSHFLHRWFGSTPEIVKSEINPAIAKVDRALAFLDTSLINGYAVGAALAGAGLLAGSYFVASSWNSDSSENQNIQSQEPEVIAGAISDSDDSDTSNSASIESDQTIDLPEHDLVEDGALFNVSNNQANELVASVASPKPESLVDTNSDTISNVSAVSGLASVAPVMNQFSFVYAQQQIAEAEKNARLAREASDEAAQAVQIVSDKIQADKNERKVPDDKDKDFKVIASAYFRQAVNVEEFLNECIQRAKNAINSNNPQKAKECALELQEFTSEVVKKQPVFGNCFSALDTARRQYQQINKV